MNRLLAALVALLTVLSASDATAKKFKNKFLSFELPKGWSCALEETEYVCQSGDPATKKHAIMVFAAKLRGDEDSLDQYVEHLRTPRMLPLGDGGFRPSTVREVRQVKISGLDWISGVHDSSEVPGFTTQYYASLKTDIAVLVTYSARTTDWESRASVISSIMASLKITR